jgi:hypothetical protein
VFAYVTSIAAWLDTVCFLIAARKEQQNETSISFIPLKHREIMASSSAHPSFPTRPSYAGSKLPERSALHPNPLPFNASAFTRRNQGEFVDNGAGKGTAHHAQSLPVHSQPQGMQQHQAHQSNNNPLNDLTEEQREEINEAVCLVSVPFLCRVQHRDTNLNVGRAPVHTLRSRP